MAATSTALTDVIIPQVFADYVTQLTQEKSVLISSGIATTDPVIQARANEGGRVVNLPYWADLGGEATRITDDMDDVLVPENLAGYSDIAVKLVRGQAWGNTDIVSIMAGANPLDALANRVAAFWAREEQRTLISVLTGVFASSAYEADVADAGMATTHVKTTSAALDAATILDAKQLLGDSSDNLVAIAMHSAKYTQLQKANLIVYLPTTQVEVRMPTYLGYRVIVDDMCPKNGADYTSYLFGAGAIAYADVSVPSPIEVYRNALASADNLISRKGWICHVRGVAWTDATGLVTNPANTVLDDAGSWKKVYQDKAIRVVKLVTH